MAVRVTAEDVTDIMTNVTAEATVIEIFITMANQVVNRVFSGDTTMGATSLKEIERFLAAHYLASTLERMGDNVKIGEAQIKYTGQYGQNLSSTPYGQAVLTMDTTGKMANIGKRVANIRSVESDYDV